MVLPGSSAKVQNTAQRFPVSRGSCDRRPERAGFWAKKKRPSVQLPTITRSASATAWKSIFVVGKTDALTPSATRCSPISSAALAVLPVRLS
jgi:hypothetical protein